MLSTYKKVYKTLASSQVTFWFNRFWCYAGSQLNIDSADLESRFRLNPIAFFSSTLSLRVESEIMVRKTTAVLVVLLFALSASATTTCESYCMNCSSKDHQAVGTNSAGHHHGQILESHLHSHSALSAGNTNLPKHSTTISNECLKTCCCQTDTTYCQDPRAVLRSAELQKSMNQAIADGYKAATVTITASAFSVSPPSSNSANSFLLISNPLPLRI